MLTPPAARQKRPLPLSSRPRASLRPPRRAPPTAAGHAGKGSSGGGAAPARGLCPAAGGGLGPAEASSRSSGNAALVALNSDRRGSFS